MDSLGTDFDALLTRGALVVLLLAAAWALAVVVAVAVEARTRGRVRIAHRTGCPPVVRLWLLGILTAVFAGLAPAQASDLGNHADSGPRSGPGAGPATTIDAALDGLRLPDRATDAPRRGAAAPVHRPVIVAAGDSLWQIARERLPGATDADVAAAVTALYAANRPVIGPDPDRLRPGQHLVFPALPTHPEEP